MVKLTDKKIKDALKEGKAITREVWLCYSKGKLAHKDGKLCWMFTGDNVKVFIPHLDDKDATDWIICEK